MLLPLPSQLCKQVRDYGVQNHQPELLPIYSKMLGMKGETQVRQKFPHPLLKVVCLSDDFEPADSLGLQPYRSVLRSVTWAGTKWSLTVWDTAEGANSSSRVR